MLPGTVLWLSCANPPTDVPVTSLSPAQAYGSRIKVSQLTEQLQNHNIYIYMMCAFCTYTPALLKNNQFAWQHTEIGCLEAFATQVGSGATDGSGSSRRWTMGFLRWSRSLDVSKPDGLHRCLDVLTEHFLENNRDLKILYPFVIGTAARKIVKEGCC